MINLYKNISLNIIKILNEDDIDDDKLEHNIEKRQEVINSLDERELEGFRKHYKDSQLLQLDNKIKILLEKKIIEVRKELNSYKTKRSINTIYVNMNKNNLNIFSRKV